MQKKKAIFTVTLISALAAAVSPVRASTEHVMILLDMSHSMTRPLENMPRIDAARKVFREVMEELSPDAVVGLRLFAQGPSQDENAACSESELAVPLSASGSREQIVTVVARRKPKGIKTPLAYALGLARDDLKGIPGKRKIILLSDGEENCDGDAEGVAQELNTMGIPVDVIGIGEDGTINLGGIALEGGGAFHLGANFLDLKKALAGGLGIGSPSTGGGGVAGSLGIQGVGVGSGGVSVTADGAGGAASRAGGQGAGVGSGPGSGQGSGNELVQVIALPTLAEDEPIHTPAAKKETPAEPVLTMELILDASGSMAQMLEGVTKIKTAKKALRETVEALDSKFIRLAFRAYGFDTSVEKTREKSCPNTELLVGFDRSRPERIVTTAASLQAYGYTPIAGSLRLAGVDLRPYKHQRPTILLISDGEETCGGNPIREIEALRAAGIDVRVHVIGFDLDADARRQLKAVAAAGNGLYYDARNYKGLIKSLKLVVEDVWAQIADSEPERFVRPVTGGGSIAAAVTLKPGRYTLKDHLAKGKKVFFHVPTQKGQHGRLRAQLQARALVKNRSGEVTEAKYAIDGMTIEVYGSDQKRINGRKARVGGKLGETDYTHYMDVTGDGFYFTVGDNYNAVHRDALFELVINEAGDRYNGQVAPADPGPDAVPVPSGQDIIGHLGLEDRADSYRIDDLTAGSSGLNVDVVFPSPDYRFTLELHDSATGKRLKKLPKLKGRASVSLSDPPAGAVIRLVDANPWLYHLFTSYQIRISRQ